MKSSQYLWLFLMAALSLPSCSSSASRPSPDTESPAWTRQATRTVEGGYIIYVGTGEDRALDRAHFKAESMALQDLVNECSFAPKGTRVEDHAEETKGLIHRSFAKVAVEFADCEAAKNAETPEQIRRLADARISEQLQRYRDQVDEPEPEESETELPRQAPPVIVRSPLQWVIVRQRIVFIKERVILAPPAAYPPTAPQTAAPIPRLGASSESVRSFERSHPDLVGQHGIPFSALRPRSDAALERRSRHAQAKASKDPIPHEKRRRGRGRRRHWG